MSYLVCGSLADGKNRFPRDGDSCECEEGWTGLNCNGGYTSLLRGMRTHDLMVVCETNKACSALVVRDPASPFKDDGEEESDAVCYKEGYGINQMFQMCDVTSESFPSSAPSETDEDISRPKDPRHAPRPSSSGHLHL